MNEKKKCYEVTRDGLTRRYVFPAGDESLQSWARADAYADYNYPGADTLVGPIDYNPDN